MVLVCKDKNLSLDQTRIMGVLNVTPDSFSDGGKFTQVDAACTHALAMQQAGADIIDVGGESTRPGAESVSLQQELDRVIPVIEALSRASDVCISIDTSKPEVMAAAVKAGAHMINDVNALRAPGAVQVAAQSQAAVCLMHMQGAPRTMQQQPHYENVVEEVYEFLQARVAECHGAGIAKEKMAIDPGFGFGKTLQHNLSLLKHLARFKDLNLPILAGMSRKSMIVKLLGERSIQERLAASIALALAAVEKGAHILRVHDVQSTLDAIRVRQAVITTE